MREPTSKVPTRNAISKNSQIRIGLFDTKKSEQNASVEMALTTRLNRAMSRRCFAM